MGQLVVVITQHHWAEVFLEEVNRQGGRTLRVNGHVFVTKASHTLIVDFGCGQYKQPVAMKMNTKKPGITMTAPTVRHRDVGNKYATGVPKIKNIRGRENIAVGTWNVRTPRPDGKLEQLTHAMSRYRRYTNNIRLSYQSKT